MARTYAAVLAICMLACAVSAADRKLLQDSFGYRDRFRVEAPEASRWSAGFATAASGPATINEKRTFTGPTPDSLALGVNPTGGFAEYKSTTRGDFILPRYSSVTRASMANTVAADLSLGTRLIPEAGFSGKYRPTVPLTFPVFGFGGKLLPEPVGQTVINPYGRVAPAPKAPAGAAKGADEGGDARRRLMNYGYDYAVKAQAPSTPQFKFSQYTPPASIASNLAVRADQPNVQAASRTPGNLIAANGATKVNIAPQKPFTVGGKGDWFVVNLSRGPTTVVSTNDAAINWGTDNLLVNNGNPLAIAQDSEAVFPNPNKYTTVAWRPQIGDRPDGFIQEDIRANVPLVDPVVIGAAAVAGAAGAAGGAAHHAGAAVGAAHDG